MWDNLLSDSVYRTTTIVLGKKKEEEAMSDRINPMDFEELSNIIEALSSSTYLDTLDRERPYDGQPWTHTGKRGSQLVSGLTIRDIRDCYIRGIFDASGLPCSEYPESLYDLDQNQIDPLAIAQNMLCWIERYMGIFPQELGLYDGNKG